LVGHSRQVWDVAFSPDSRQIAAGGEDHTTRLWNTAPGALVAEACRIANRNLSRSEWNRYLGSDTPYERTCGDLPPGDGAPG
jgi:WD40 repeat protein